MVLSRNSRWIEASKIGSWFRITSARYQIVEDEISLHWASFEPEQPHIMHSSTIYHGAKRNIFAPPHKHSMGFLPTCLGGRKQANVFEGGRGLYSKILQGINILYLLALLCNNFQNYIFFSNDYKCNLIILPLLLRLCDVTYDVTYLKFQH